PVLDQTPERGPGVRRLALPRAALYHLAMSSPDDIQQEEKDGRGAFFLEREGRRLAKMTYRRVTEALIIIEHTEVSDELRGQGIARKLLDTAVAWARATGTKLKATCPYVSAQFAKDPSIGDVRG